MKANRKRSDPGLMARLEAHLELKARMERILDLAENRGGDVFRAAEAEERAICEIRALGQEVLQDWAKRQVEETSKQAVEAGGIRAKKNRSTGTAVLGK